jgi:phage-related protein
MVEVKRATQLGALGLAVAMTLPAMGFQRPQGKSNDNKSSSNGSTSRPGPRAGDWLRRNMNTPPAQQQQELEKSDDFKKLPPQQQQRMLKQLNRFNLMSPDQKNRVLSHMDKWDRLTPEQKERASALHQQFHSLDSERRQAIRRALFGMRDMTPDERQKNLESPQMKKDFNDQEREIMKGYTALGFPDNHAEVEGGGSPQEDK